MTTTQTPPMAALLGEMQAEARVTRALIERLPADKLGWRPHARSFTLGQQALHIATIPSIFARVLVEDSFDFATADTTTPQPANRAEILAALDQGLADCNAAFGAWDASELARTWRVTRGEKEIMALPKGAALRSLLCNHVYHHRGQLALYLRLLDVPLPPVYGPTADENPFS